MSFNYQNAIPTITEGVDRIGKNGGIRGYLARAQAPTFVTTQLAKMSQEGRDMFYAEYNQRSKSVIVAYLAWLCLGWHYVYTKNWFLQLLYWATLGGMFIWMSIDLFRMPRIVRSYNRKVAVQILRDLKSVGVV